MTEQEAMELLKCHNDKCSGCDKLCDDSCKPAVELAITALEKQIPQKVDAECFCPVCGSWCADEDENVDNYCMNCGQKLQAAGSEEA